MKKRFNFLKLVVMGASLMFIFGCASARQYVSLPDQSKRLENPDKARIYVIRPGVFGSAIHMVVNDYDRPIGETGPKSFLCWEREPGEAKIYSTSENTSEIAFDVKAGEVHYLLQKPEMGWVTLRNSMVKISESEGKASLKKCKAPKPSAR